MAQLIRPAKGRVIAGVCAGIAQRFGWSPTVVRLAFLLSCLLPGPQFLIYIALWILVPSEL
jgi:phage shock protein C